MRAELLPDTLTPLTPGEVARAFHAAFYTIVGVPPTHRTLSILLAQSALESGRWKSLHCLNFTNIKASETYEGYYCLYRCNEIINGRVEWFDPPHPQCRFRAYQSIHDAALDYLRFLHDRKRYQASWAQAIAGDPVAFVAALKAAGFFTANEGPYRKAVLSLTNEYAPQIAAWLADVPDPPEQPGELTDDTLHALAVRAVGQQFDPLDLDADGFADHDTDPAPPPESAA